MSCGATLRPVLLLSTLVGSPLGAAAQETACADSLVESFRAEHGIPAVAAAVLRDGVVVYNRASGPAHVELGVPASPSTLFQLSSTAKAFTGVLAMWLVEHGRLELDAPITRYLPAAPAGWAPVTLRHALTNTAGVSGLDAVAGALEGERSPDEVLAALYRLSPAPRPGEAFEYGGGSYFVAQQAIERATGQDLASLMRAEVLGPAGMTRASYWGSSLEVLEGAATDYYPDGSGGLRQRDFVFPRYLWGAGGLAASAEDLLRFGRALSTHRLLEPESVEEMWTSVELVDGSRVTYGLGWDTKTHAPGQPSAGHSGGYLTTFRVYPRSRLTVVLLTNGFRRSFNPDDFATALASVWDPAIIGLGERACAAAALGEAVF